MHPVLLRVLLVVGTGGPLVVLFGVFLSRRPRPHWVRVVAILVGVAGLAWGVLDVLLVYRHVPHDMFRRFAQYRDTIGWIAVAGIFAIAIEDIQWKKRVRNNPHSHQT